MDHIAPPRTRLFALVRHEPMGGRPPPLGAYAPFCIVASGFVAVPDFLVSELTIKPLALPTERCIEEQTRTTPIQPVSRDQWAERVYFPMQRSVEARDLK